MQPEFENNSAQEFEVLKSICLFQRSAGSTSKIQVPVIGARHFWKYDPTE